MKPHDVVTEPPAAAWIEALVRGLIFRAAHRAPPELAERLEEEWLADLAARQGPLARLRFAAGCCWAARTIALELGTPVRVAAAAAGSRAVAVCDGPRAPSAWPRPLILIAIAGFHVLLFYAFTAGLTPGAIARLPTAIGAFFIEKQPEPVELPLPAAPRITRELLTVPRPLIPYGVLPSLDRLAVVEEQSPLGAQPPLQVAPPVRRVGGGPGAGFPNAEDHYPAAARRFGQEGAATVRVCVNEAGRLTAPPAMATSSGNALLDDGALELAKAGSGHYRPTTEDGRPVSSCYPFRIRFQMKHQP